MRRRATPTQGERLLNAGSVLVCLWGALLWIRAPEAREAFTAWHAALILAPWACLLWLDAKRPLPAAAQRRLLHWLEVHLIGLALAAAGLLFYFDRPPGWLWFAPLGLGVARLVQFVVRPDFPVVRWMRPGLVPAAGEILIPQIALFGFERLAFNLKPDWMVHLMLALAAAGVAWALRRWPDSRRLPLGAVLCWIPVAVVLAWQPDGLNGRQLAALLGCSGLALWLHALAIRHLGRTAAQPAGELLRCWLLLLAGLWLMEPLLTSNANGSGDAHWYALVLADFTQQFRAGIFPVFVGQSEFAFSGGVFPSRFSPYYQNLGVGLDVVTGRALGIFALKHLTVVLSGIGGIFSAYFTLCALTPRFRWTNAALAFLYVSCPAVLASIYSMDMYLTFMTVPWLPLVVYGTVRSCQRLDWLTPIWLAAPLAMLWYAHAPVALWCTLFATAAQLGRLCWQWRGWRRELHLALCGSGLFGLLAVFPFVSAGYVEKSTGTFNARDAVDLMASVFAQAGLPVSDAANGLGDQKLGYGLLGLLLVSLAVAAHRRALLVSLLLAGSSTALAVVTPIPGLTERFWQALPGAVTAITHHAPSQRLLPIAAILAVFGGALAWRWIRRWGRPALYGLSLGLGLAVVWQASEATKFLRRGHATMLDAEGTARLTRAENIVPSRYAYEMFSQRPDYFQNGFMDPRINSRLLDSVTLAPIRNRPMPVPGHQQAFELRGRVTPGTSEVIMSTPLVLVPGQRYVLRFSFHDLDYSGVLQVIGSRLFREYRLPVDGGNASFGSGEGQRKFITLWTTRSQPEIVRLRFQSTSTRNAPRDFQRFARVTFGPIAPDSLPVHIESLVPYRATIQTQQAAWLETIRMYAPGYTARVNGQPAALEKSPQGLVMIPVPPGFSRVEVIYVGPPLLRAAFWLALLAWSSLLLFILLKPRLTRHPHLPVEQPQPSPT